MIYSNESKNEFVKKVYEARKELLCEKNFEKAVESLKKLLVNPDKDYIRFVKQSLALAYFQGMQYTDASQIFHELDERYQEGFCYLLQGNERKAREIWYNSKPSEAISWGRCLIDHIRRDVQEIPSFIQIRNHLESDITYFIKAGKLDYASNVVHLADFFADINLESYKFIGKALMFSGYANLAIKYFNQAKEIIPQDAENYYHIAVYFIMNKAPEEAKEMIELCLSYNENYTPAKNLIKTLNLI